MRIVDALEADESARLTDQVERLAHHAFRGEAWDKAVRDYEAYALRLLGEIAAYGDTRDAEAGEARYRQALTLADELGMRPLQAHCHLGLGTLYAMTGQREKASAELSAAIALYRAMAMTFWLPQAEAASVQVVEVTRPRRRRKKRL